MKNCTKNLIFNLISNAYLYSGFLFAFPCIKISFVGNYERDDVNWIVPENERIFRLRNLWSSTMRPWTSNIPLLLCILSHATNFVVFILSEFIIRHFICTTCKSLKSLDQSLSQTQKLARSDNDAAVRLDFSCC